MAGFFVPKGFKAAGVHAGFKKDKPDFAVFVSEKPCEWSGVFTKNLFAAAPVLDSKSKLGGKVRAIIVNSGCANACTGVAGKAAVAQSCKIASKALGCNGPEVLQASTGVIGRPLDVSKIEKGVAAAVTGLSDSPAAFSGAASAIITTDQYVKISSAQFAAGGKTASVLGIAKGAGMIDPCMATMLCFLFTDASVEKSELEHGLKAAVSNSFNSISVDGETSTNDSAILLSSGALGNAPVAKGGSGAKDFEEALSKVCLDLALLIVADGEGAKKVLEVNVEGAASDEDAVVAAGAVVNSLLVKCAVFGGDPNWGRVASAIGASGASVVPARTAISIGGVVLFEKGEPKAAEKNAAAKMAEKKVVVRVDLGLGTGKGTKWGCDLTHEYVDLNSKYST